MNHTKNIKLKTIDDDDDDEKTMFFVLEDEKRKMIRKEKKIQKFDNEMKKMEKEKASKKYT